MGRLLGAVPAAPRARRPSEVWGCTPLAAAAEIRATGLPGVKSLRPEGLGCVPRLLTVLRPRSFEPPALPRQSKLRPRGRRRQGAVVCSSAGLLAWGALGALLAGDL